MRLWTFLTSLVATAALCAFAATAQGAVQNTKHNMNLTFPGSIQNNEVCVPCHAPHNQPDQVDEDTLWNHVMPANTYTLYGSGTGWVGLDTTSRKCLSCHDGTVAVDSYGGYNFTTENFQPTSGSHKLAGTAWQVGGGQNLSHDHPVGIVYPGLASGGTTWTTTSGFNSPLLFNTKTYQGHDTNNNVVTLNYTSDGTTPISAAGGGWSFGTTGTNVNNVVGCGTCHTPHSSTYNFLVISNYGSQMCMTCHTR
jgi:predicted CXXCH cytochrome family protein